MKRIILLDAARGVAIILVLVFHIFPELLPSGYIGVDCFFVLAGFLAIESLKKRSASLKGVLSYPIARFKRLAPAALVTMAVVAILTALLIPAPDDLIMRNMHQAVMGMRFDEYLTASGNNYFGQAEGFNPYLHFWTISSEIKYYVLAFILYVASVLIAKVSGASAKLINAIRLGAVMLASIASFSTFLETNSYYLFSSRLWQFGLGSALALLLELTPSLLSQAERIVTSTHQNLKASLVGGSCLVVFLAASPMGNNASPKQLHLLAIAVALVVITIAKMDAIAAASSNSDPEQPQAFIHYLAAIGIISYSLYLVHWPIVVFTRWTWGDEDLGSRLVALALSIALGYLLHRFVEAKPIPLLATGGLTALAAFSTLPSELASSHVNPPSRLYLGKHQFRQEDLNGPGYRNAELERTIWSNCNNHSQASPSDYFAKCQVTFNTDQNIYVFGDSSAGVLKTELSKLSENQSFGLSIHTVEACFLPDLNKGGSRCQDSTKGYLDFLNETTKPDDLVVISFTGWGENTTASQAKTILRHYISKVHPESTVILLGPYPIWSIQEPIRCFANFGNAPQGCTQPANNEDYKKQIETLHGIANELQSKQARNIHVIDQYQLLCDERTCSVVDQQDQRLLYKDDGHLTNYGTAKIVAAIQDHYLSSNLTKTSDSNQP